MFTSSVIEISRRNLEAFAHEAHPASRQMMSLRFEFKPGLLRFTVSMSRLRSYNLDMPGVSVLDPNSCPFSAALRIRHNDLHPER